LRSATVAVSRGGDDLRVVWYSQKLIDSLGEDLDALVSRDPGHR